MFIECVVFVSIMNVCHVLVVSVCVYVVSGFIGCTLLFDYAVYLVSLCFDYLHLSICVSLLAFM